MALCLGLLNSSGKCLWFSLCWNPGLWEISGNFSFNPDSWLMCYCYCLTGICSRKEHISWYLVHIANTNSEFLTLVPFHKAQGLVIWKPAGLLYLEKHRDLVLKELDQASQKNQTPSSKTSVKHLNAYFLFLLHSASFSSKSKGNSATGLHKWLFQMTQIRCDTCWSHVAARTVSGYSHFSRFKHLSLDNKGTALHR